MMIVRQPDCAVEEQALPAKRAHLGIIAVQGETPAMTALQELFDPTARLVAPAMTRMLTLKP